MLAVVGSEGYDAASVRMVLERADLYRQAFYDEFADKEDCYLQALVFGAERLEAIARAGAVRGEGWRGQLRAGLEAVLESFDSEPWIGRAVVVEVHAAGSDALAIRSKAMKRLTEFIDSARAVAGVTEAPPPIAAEGIVAGMHAVIHAKLAAGDDSGFAELLPDFMYFAVLPYFGPEAADIEMKSARAAL